MLSLFKFRWSVVMALSLFLVLAGHPHGVDARGGRGGGEGNGGCPHERAGLPAQDHSPQTFAWYLLSYPGGQFIAGEFGSRQTCEAARVAYTERAFRSAECVLMGSGR